MERKGSGKALFVIVLTILVISSFLIFLFWDNIGNLLNFKKDIDVTAEEKAKVMVIVTDLEGKRLNATLNAGFYNYNEKTGEYGQFYEEFVGFTGLDTTNIFEMPINKTPFIYITHNGCYSALTSFSSLIKEKINDVSVELTCSGNVTINALNQISEIEGKLKLNVTTIGEIRKPILCLSRTYGIPQATFEEDSIFCNSGNWTSVLGDSYSCDNENSMIETCKRVDGNICIKGEVEIPKRLITKVDSCHAKELTLKDNSNQIDVKYKTNKNTICNDKITFWIIDQEREIKREPRRYLTEMDGKDIGAPDIKQEFRVC